MPDRIHIPRPESRGTDANAWVPEVIHGGVLALLAGAILVFVRVFSAVKERLGLGGERGWALVIGFVIIELYLIVRTLRQLRKARDTYTAARPPRP
ncbi:MAG: hypothetical protein R3E97_08150 [Candidatus Eisenbacteria bacterium]